MKNLNKHQIIAIGSSIAALYAVLCLVAFASAASRTEKPAAVDAEQYADFMGREVLDIQDLAEGAEVQRRMFNRITPPGLSWTQPMFPPVAPFDAQYFDGQFLEGLLGEDKNSVAIYPLSLIQDPQTRETLIYNAEGELIAAIPADGVSREWPTDADPSRVILQLDLLPAEDVEPYLYTERRIEETLARHNAPRSAKSGGAATRGLEAGEFGICNIQGTTNGTMFITVTNGVNVAEVFAYTVWHTSSVVVVTWTNEQSNVVTDTNTVWHQVSPAFNGLESAWECLTTNLVLTNGVGIYEDANISSNARIRFYAVANRQDSDGDGLTDGSEIFLHHTDPQSIDTDGDGLLDGYDIPVWIGEPRYTAWANNIVFSSSEGLRIFKGELSAGSDPLADDTDSDGLPDGWEVKNALDPLDAEGDDGPEGDPDEDGFENALELELGAPANNAAWNGEQLAYRLTHVTPVIVTNARSITTNWIGLRVTVEDSWDCVTGGNTGRQNETVALDGPALLECGYYIKIGINGLVEDVDKNYDEVYFEAYSNNLYFSSHDGIPEGVDEECLMVKEHDDKNNLILANSTVVLRYNTVGYRWHSGAYAEIISATNTGPYKVLVSGEDFICVGETTQMEASGAAGEPYTWSGNGNIAVGTNGVVTGLAPGIATVIATDAGGCRGEKKIIVFKIDLITPAGDPINAAVQSGDGQNEFTYSTASPGVLTMNLKARVTPSGIASWIRDRCLFAVDTIAGSTLAWDAANLGGKPTASGDDLLATVTFTGLPANNMAFGSKRATVYFKAYKQDERFYEVFYPRNEKNHPANSSNADWPNWMFYWLQTVTPLGSPAPTFKYGTYTRFTPGTTEITLSDGDAESFSAPYGNHNPLKGIDNFTWTVIHESQHYKDWLDLWSNNYADWLHNHRGNSGPGDDKDADRIPNSTEDVNLNGAYDAGDLYDWEAYNTPTPGRPASILNDFEDWNCQRHTGVTGDHSGDWGDPGMQHQTKDKYND